jgi:hypothetical protein
MLTDGGYLADPLTLAQRLMEKLQVDLTDDIDGGASSEMYVALFNASLISQARTIFSARFPLPERACSSISDA